MLANLNQMVIFVAGDPVAGQSWQNFNITPIVMGFHYKDYVCAYFTVLLKKSMWFSITWQMKSNYTP